MQIKIMLVTKEKCKKINQKTKRYVKKRWSVAKIETVD